MNGDEKEEAQRPRPLSGGIWTLFHWLRRTERSSSSESLSSVGSARTAASFDFLSPGNYSIANPPVVLSPLSPPTNSYKKRLQDRNLRRQRDCDITLHRKYGLFRGYDGFSLPPTRRVVTSTIDRQNRDRRATSECLQRRAAYVPGKRRAPLPPVLTTSATLPRNYKRKRQAPKPPVQIIQQNIQQQKKQSVRMNSKSGCDNQLSENDSVIRNNTGKCERKGTHSKDTKVKSDKSFLKQIFENRKRNSATEITAVRLLPSISELDKQAAEIIEINKLRHNRNSVNNAVSCTSHYEGNVWFCTSCLRKYNASVEACIYCQFEVTKEVKSVSPSSTTSAHKISSKHNATSFGQPNVDEQKILKEILKEMKDSLPKRPKDNNDVLITETPTLRIGLTSNGIKSTTLSSKDIIATTSMNGLSASKDNKKITHNITSKSIFPIKRRDEELDMNHNVSKKEIEAKKFTDSISQQETSSAFKNNGQSLLSSQISEKTKDVASSSKVVSSHFSCFYPSEAISENIKNEIRSVHNPKSNTLVESETEEPETSCTSSEVYRERIIDEINSNSKFNKPHNNLLLESEFPKAGSSKSGLTNISTNIEHKPNLLEKITESKQSNSNLEASSKPLSDKKIEGPISSKDLSLSDIPPDNASSVKLPITSPEIVKSLFTHNNSSSSFTDKKNERTPTVITSAPSQIQNIRGQIKPFQSSIVTFQTESSLHTPLKISSLLNPIYSPRISTFENNKNIDHEQLSPNEGLLHSNSNNKSIAGKICSDKKDLEKLTESEDRLKVASTIADIIKTKNTEAKMKKSTNAVTNTFINNDLLKEEHGKKEEKSQGKLYERNALPSTSNNVATSSSKIDKLDLYNKRRHLINQLEQSIAKGDETAAAEAAAKLAKLRLSCSVLSFSSQIVAECLNQSDTDISLETKTNVPQSRTNLQSNVDIQTEKRGVPDKKVKQEKQLINNVSQLTEVKEEKKSESKKNPIQSSSTQTTTEEIVSIEVWIEDKQAARGPIRLRIPRRATMRDLRRQAERSLGLDARLQRWIVGRNLCTDDVASIVSLAGSDFSAPFYLCLVQSEANNKQENDIKNSDNTGKDPNQNGAFYSELIKLEQQALVPNIEPFECEVCMEECAAQGGVVLRECIHTFCRECLSDVVRHCEDPAVSCPATGCSGFLQEREIRSLMSSEDYDRWLARSLATAENGTRNTFHCRTRDCAGWAFCEPGVRRFPCPVCKCTNCVPCQAIHEGEMCEQYQEKLRNAVTATETNKADEGTQAFINSLLSRGEALECPECRAIITKKWGCDWVKCSACKTEICWITKGRRWGPGGRGDTTGGCRCGVDGKRCHPLCGYCH